MNEEEKEAIAHLEWLLDSGILASEDEPYMQAILNLIEKQNKVINEMAEFYKNKDTDILGVCDNCEYNNEDCHGDYCKEALIKYYYKEVSKDE